MESRWYLSPGQTLETTKIEDRGHALHVTANSWGKITAHLDRNRLMQEAIDKERATREAQKKGSEKMTKNWDNSVENIRKRKEEKRQSRLEKEQEDRMQRFLQMHKEQAVVREKFIADARRSIYISKGYPKELTSALLLSDVMYERERQIELEKKIERFRVEDEAEYAKKVKEGARQELIEKEAYEQQIVKKKLEIKEMYLNEINKNEAERKASKQGSIDRETIDNMNSDKETEKIKQIEKEEERKRIELIKEEFKKFEEQQLKNKRLLEQEDLEQDIVIDIYEKAKHRITCLKLKKEKEMQAAMQLRKDAAAKKVVSNAAAKADNERRILQKAMAEQEQEELDKLRLKAEFKERLIEERNEDRRRFLQKEEERKREEAEVRKWEMLNRFKTDGAIKDYELAKKQRLWEEILQQRRDLFEQMDEKEEVRKLQIREEDELYKQSLKKFEEEDKAFFQYAEEVYNDAKARGRTTAPIERVIEEYKKANSLPRNVNKICENYEAQSKSNPRYVTRMAKKDCNKKSQQVR